MYGAHLLKTSTFQLKNGQSPFLLIRFLLNNPFPVSRDQHFKIVYLSLDALADVGVLDAFALQSSFYHLAGGFDVQEL